MRDIHGTNAIGGLDLGKAAHLIDDSSLLQSDNGWTDRAGEWSVAPGNTRLYSGYSDIEDCCAGIIDGVEVVVYLDGNTLYADGVSVGTVAGTGDKQIIAVADGFIIVGGTENYVYDTNGLRHQGTWQADYVQNDGDFRNGIEITSGAAAKEGIKQCEIASGGYAELELLSLILAPTGYAIGDLVFISDAGSTVPNINDKFFTVTAVDTVAHTITINGDPRTSAYSNAYEYIGNIEKVVAGGIISAITREVNPTITSTVSYSAGDLVYIDEVVGMTQVNGNTYQVLENVSATSFKIITDTTNHSAYTSGGISVGNYSGYGGGYYSYYIVPALELSDGTILEGKPRGLHQRTDFSSIETGPDEPWEAESILINSNDKIDIKSNVRFDVASYFYISGTIGVDYWPMLRLYRTKLNGTDIYLEEEFKYGADVYGSLLEFNSSDSIFYITSTDTTYSYQSFKKDIDLGGVYLYSTTNQENPVPATTACRFGDQIFFVEQDDGHRVHWTNSGSPMFSNPTNDVYIIDKVTAIRTFRNEVIIFSPRFIWAMQMVDGFPAIRVIETSVGSTYPKAMEEVPGALLFLREDGIWAFDGIKTFNTSHNTFYGTDTPVSIAASGDLVVAQWQSTGLVGKDTAAGTVWHDMDMTGAIVTDSGGSLYCADDNMIYTMFDGNRTCATLISKAFDTTVKSQTPSGGIVERRVYRVTLDVTGQDIQECWINGSRQDDTLLHDARGDTSDRRLVRISIPRLSNPYITIKLQIGGNAVVHGYSFETEQ